MVIEEDVYDSTATTLLIKHGATLTADMIEKTRNINKGRDTIYVSGNTYRTLIEKNPPPKPDIRQELEEETGYTSIKDVTNDILEDIARNQVLQTETIHSVSEELSNHLEVSTPATVLSLINALAPVDEYFQRHCINVSLLNGLFGRWLKLPKAEVDRLVLIGLSHDCGKALIPAQVLNAPRRLTVVEFEVIKMHSVFSFELLAKFPEPIRHAVRYHHEKTGGAGYPDQLHGKKIPLEERINAVSDIYDAKGTRRAYKGPNSPFSTMAMLQRLKSNELDPILVDLFIHQMPYELLNKLVMMSDGAIGVLRSFDPSDIEYPYVEVGGRVMKSNENWRCMHMHSEERESLPQ